MIKQLQASCFPNLTLLYSCKSNLLMLDEMPLLEHSEKAADD